MRILVTGAGGFVAAHMFDFLRTQAPDAELFGLERPRAGAPWGPIPKVRFFEADLNDPSSVDPVLDAAMPDQIVHLAGQSSVHQSWLDPGGTLRTNVLGLVHLLDGVRRRRLTPSVLVVGSADEYGIAAADELPLREETPLRPASPYAVSKVAQGALALLYPRSGGLRIVLTRTFPHTGPGRGEAFAESSFARQIAEIEAGLRPPVIEVGNLDAIRDYCDVRDVVRAYWALLAHGKSGEVYNVCSGRGIRIRELLDILVTLSEATVEVRVDPTRLRPSDVPAQVGDNTKLKLATGWEPRIPLEVSLGDLLLRWRAFTGGPAKGPEPVA
jgi:GDP-4-dehydro-6-deoxy-D-mannose reductase